MFYTSELKNGKEETVYFHIPIENMKIDESVKFSA
jgi:hypothetical protein